MPEEGVPAIPRSQMATYEELLSIIDTFIGLGVRKVRITGGEPLVRKQVGILLDGLGERPVELAMTTNATLVHRYLHQLKRIGLTRLNVSLDTLQPFKFRLITRRDGYEQIQRNIELLINEGFELKINVVLMKGTNDDEILDFVEWTRHTPISVRFIEFMPFDGNQWDHSQMVSYAEIMDLLQRHYSLKRLSDGPHDTSKDWRVEGFAGTVGIISSMTDHFCAGCNRLRLSASGKMRNCLFTEHETDLLTPLRQGRDIEPLIRENLWWKKAAHAGMQELSRSPSGVMTQIGG